MEHQVKRCIDDITRVHLTLSQTADLRPSELVNGLFGELVSLCTQTLSTSSTKQILEDQRIQDLTPSLRKLCATAESHLESHWAGHISGAVESEDEIGVNHLTAAESLAETTAFRRLGQFPYYENYKDLTHMELCAIHAVNASPPRKIAFIGSGPLPLSSLCLCQALDKLRRTAAFTTVLNIDNNPQAIFQSQGLTESLGSLSRGMEFLCKEVGSSHLDLSGFDVVYLAALVGLTQAEKESVLVKVVGGMSVGALVIIRSAHGLRSLLYPEFNVTTEAILACLEVCLVVHPYNHIVNSVIVGRVKPRARIGSKL